VVLNKQARVLGTAEGPGATEHGGRLTLPIGVREGARQKRRRKLSAYLYVLPALVLVVGMFWYSAVVTVQLSFTNSSGLGPAQYVGLSNYRAMLSDSQLSTNVYNTLIWAVAMVVLPVSIGLGAAIMVKSRRGGVLFQTVFYLPYAIGFVTTGVIWSFLFSTNGFSTLFQAMGLHSLASVQWLNDVPLNTYSMITASTWQTMGVDMLLFLVGLDTIDRSVVEAARIDGAAGWQMFRKMTFPLLTPMTRVIIAISIVNALQAFNLIWVMTEGGPYGSSSTFAVWMYTESFELLKMGDGAAIAAILTIFVFAVSIGYLRRSLREVTA
jgi:ABC-type sugar transport system permease subunit